MIVIPMAGLSSRFFKAGYEKPKYMLEAHGKTLFDFAVSSFSRYFDSDFFVFIVKKNFETPRFVAEHSEKLGIKNYKIFIIDHDTRGQADSVYQALKRLGSLSESITIFNIDTYRPFFKYPEFIDSCDGYLEVFKGEGDHWSFAKPSNALGVDNEIEMTAEKKRISDLCSTGLYYFRSFADYCEAFQIIAAKPKDEWPKGELYIAPMYNLLIQQGMSIRYNLVSREQVAFFGTPQEYMDFCKDGLKN